jgi:hypothetical protein
LMVSIETEMYDFILLFNIRIPWVWKYLWSHYRHSQTTMHLVL